MYDAIIIGAGPGGSDCGIEIAKLGGKVAVIEKSEIGGTCLNWGCIPTKTLIHSSKIIKEIKNGAKLGFKVDGLEIDFPKLVKRKERVINSLKLGLQMQLDTYGVEYIKGEAIIKSKNKILINDKTLETKNIIISTGSVPNKIFEGKNIMTSDDILSLETIPENLTVVGGGVIGLEYAMLFNALGSKVTIIEALDRCLTMADKEISTEIEAILKRNNITLYTNTGANYKDEIMFAGEKEITYNKILLATGRKAIFPQGLDELNINYDKLIEVNSKYQTNIENIYAIGDVSSEIQLAHLATYQGKVVAKSIMGKKSKNDSVVPFCIYTMPEVAHVGATEDECEGEIIIKKSKYAANALAKCNDSQFGFIKIIADKKTEQIIGVHIIGENATSLISEATLFIQKKMTLEEIKEIIHPHPTYSEVFKEAIDN